MLFHYQNYPWLYGNCYNSAQVMLAVCSLRDLLTMSSQELISTIPWVPAKVLKVVITLMVVTKVLNNFL